MRRYTSVTIPMIARMRALRGVGLSCEAVARVIELDYGLYPSKRTVYTYTTKADSDPIGTVGTRGANW